MISCHQQSIFTLIKFLFAIVSLHLSSKEVMAGKEEEAKRKTREQCREKKKIDNGKRKGNGKEKKTQIKWMKTVAVAWLC